MSSSPENVRASPPRDGVLIYGPPAAGKLTVAACLAARVPRFAVLHNHLTRDLVRALPLAGERHDRLVERLRLACVEELLAAGFGMVMTTAFFPDRSGSAFLETLDEVVRGAGGSLHRVQLCPPVGVLERRVVEPGRRVHRKLSKVDELREALAEHDWYAKVSPDDPSIDNSDMTAEEVVSVLIEHFGLVESA